MSIINLKLKIMNDECGSQPKRCLRGTLEIFNNRAISLMDLAELSDRVYRSLSNPNPEPICNGEEITSEEKQKCSPSLVELFNDQAEGMQNSINQIGNNLERILNMIE